MDDEPQEAYVCPHLDLMAAIMIGLQTHNRECLDFPATLTVLLGLAAEALEKSGCCAGRDDKWSGIATALGSRIEARSRVITDQFTGYINEAVIASEYLHAAILRVIDPEGERK